MRRVQKFVIALCVFAILSFGLNGRASILHGSTDRVDLASPNEGAKVYIDGSLMGTVPLTLELKSNRDYRIEFRKPGYDSKTVLLNSSVGAGWIIVDVLLGVLPVIVDAATGNWSSLDQTNLNVELEKQK